jgi:hypothetical protein
MLHDGMRAKAKYLSEFHAKGKEPRESYTPNIHVLELFALTRMFGNM